MITDEAFQSLVLRVELLEMKQREGEPFRRKIIDSCEDQEVAEFFAKNLGTTLVEIQKKDRHEHLVEKRAALAMALHQNGWTRYRIATQLKRGYVTVTNLLRRDARYWKKEK